MPVHNSTVTNGDDASRVAVFAKAARHSRRVRLLKLALPVAGVATVALFLAWSWLSRPDIPVAVSVDDAVLADGKLVMTNPKLGGVNKDNQRYAMTAARAVQDGGKADLIHLEQIEADLPLASENRAKITAEGGLYDRAASTMRIDTPLTATTTDGMVARLAGADVDLEAGSLKTDKPVDILMRGSHITAESMSIADRGRTIVFERRVRLTLEPGAVRTSDQTGADNGGR